MILLAVLPGCGRIHFDPLGADDAVIDTSIDPGPRCNPQAPFTSITRIDSLSTPQVDGGARLNADETVAFFHSDRGGGFRIWSATRASRDLPFETPATAHGAVPFWPTVTSDGLTLVYSNTALYMSTRATEADVFPVGALITSLDVSGTEANPFFGPLGTTLYMSIGEPDSKIAAASWPPTMPAVPIAELDTASNESAPVLSDHELVIYFTSELAGSADIYMAERATLTSSFGPAVPVAELNSGGPESPTSLSPDLCRLYFETARGGGTTYDIYLAERAP